MQREPRNNLQQDDAQALPGVIDTIGNAFGLLSRRPYLVWLPILLDLFLWLGARLSANSLVTVTERWLRQEALADDETTEALRTMVDGVNLFDLIGVIAPTLLSNLGATSVAGGTDVWVDGLPWWSIPPLALLLILVGIAIGMGYLTMVSYLIREQPVALGVLFADSVRNTVRMLGFVGVVLGLLALLFTPVIMFSGILLMAGINVIPLSTLVLTMAITWGLLVLFFARDAIVVTHAGPLRAIYLSYNVVRRYFWPAIGFIVVYFLVRNGLPIALQIFTQSPWSVPFAIIGHAYVATGLIAAGMLFYRDRAQRLTTTKTQTTDSRTLSH